MTKRFIILVLAVIALAIPASTARASYSDPSSGGQAACTWYNQGQIINGAAWSWYYGVWGYRDGYHICYTRYGSPAWLFVPR